MPTERLAPPPGASPTGQARELKAYADAHDCIMVRTSTTCRIQILCSGVTNSGKSTPPTTEPRERPTNQATTLPVRQGTGIQGDCATLFVSLELSHSTWVATSLAPGSKKISKHTLVGGNGRKLLELLARLKTRAEQHIAAPVKIVTIHEVGLDGFWVHRLLDANGIESHVVDPASIAVPRRHRRAKTDAIDGETLLRTLMAWQRGEPRVCAMTVPPSPSEEDRRRVSQARDAATGAHSAHEPHSRTAVRPGDRQLQSAEQEPPRMSGTTADRRRTLGAGSPQVGDSSRDRPARVGLTPDQRGRS
jgi:hypothetical protein